MQAYGWGDTKYGNRNGSNILQEINVTVVTPEVCQETLDAYCKAEYGEYEEYEDEYNQCLKNNLTDGMLCAGSLGNRRKSVCNVSTLVEKLPSFLQSIITKREFLIIMSIPIHKYNPG